MHLDQKTKVPFQIMLQRLGLYQFLRSLAVGLVHCLAGSAAALERIPIAVSYIDVGFSDQAEMM
jgi:hypothetical protein